MARREVAPESANSSEVSPESTSSPGGDADADDDGVLGGSVTGDADADDDGVLGGSVTGDADAGGEGGGRSDGGVISHAFGGPLVAESEDSYVVEVPVHAACLTFFLIPQFVFAPRNAVASMNINFDPEREPVSQSLRT